MGDAFGEAFIRTVIADKPQIMAFFAFLQGMVRQELIQMSFLVRREHAGTAAKRAGAVKGCQNGISNELGAIRDTFHGLKKGIVCLEGDDLVFGLIHCASPLSPM
jgi:hypothetical protein